MKAEKREKRKETRGGWAGRAGPSLFLIVYLFSP